MTAEIRTERGSLIICADLTYESQYDFSSL